MNDEQKPGPSPLVTRRHAILGYDARSERRALRGAARRRKARTRLWLVVGPALVVIAVIVTLLVLLGGPGSGGGAVVTSTTLAKPAGGGTLLILEENDTVPYLVLIETTDAGGLALAMPGMTLLKTPDGYKTLAEIHTAGNDESLDAVLVDAFGVGVQTTASVSWTVLREAMVQAGIADIPPAALTSAEGEPDKVAQAVVALVAAAGTASGAAAWEGLALAGDVPAFRAAVNAAASLSADKWTATALTGDLVEGADFTYLEPDADRVKALLAGTKQGVGITVEVQNGSGTLGVTDQVAAQLEPLGYTVSASGNSDDFPNVTQTRIVAAADSSEAGARVKMILGVGVVTADDTLESGHVVVVVGADYVSPVSTTTGSTG